MFLSVIIPVYNAEKYLPECLDSLTSQDFPDAEYEIICVNDGSKDQSSSVIRNYGDAHPQVSIVLIEQSNQGVSVARNTGIEHARGEYLWFVDADDFVDGESFARLFQIVRKSMPDKVSFAHYEVQNTLTEDEAELKSKHMLSGNATPAGTNIWESVFKREVVLAHNVRFREGISYSEDTLFCYEFDQAASSAETTEEILYFYRRNAASVTRLFDEAANRRRVHSCYKVAKVILGYLKRKRNGIADVNTDEAAQILIGDVRRVLINTAKLAGKERREILSELRKLGLFPYFPYKNRLNVRPTKDDLPTAYKGRLGIVRDVLNFYCVTRLGFFLLRIYNYLYLNANKLRFRKHRLG